MPPLCNARLLARFLTAIILLCAMFVVIVSDGSVEPYAFRFGVGGMVALKIIELKSQHIAMIRFFLMRIGVGVLFNTTHHCFVEGT